MNPPTVFFKNFSTFFILLLSAFLAFYFRRAGIFDPDRYFHFSISHLVANNFTFPLTLHGPAGIGWDKFFPEKEFLFHLLTGIAYKISGEQGVLLLIGTIFCAFNLVLFLTLKKLFTVKNAIITYLVFLPTQTHVLLRMNFLRPHTLSITFFFLLVYVLIQNHKLKNYFTALVCTLFALSYHGFYLLFPILGLHFIFTFKLSLRNAIQNLVYGLLGVGAGIVLNPYFPGNIEMSIRTLSIALFETQTANLNFGQELIPWRSDFLLRHALWAILGLGSTWLFYSEQKHKIRDWRYEFIWFLTGFFWLLTLLSPRAQEMAIPLSLLAMGQLFNRPENLKSRVGAAAVVFAVAFTPFHEAIKNPSPNDESLLKFISFLKNRPEEDLKVFNVDWDMSPYIQYAKPSFAFLDILDPSFLYYKNRDLHNSRDKLANGFGIDPYGMLKATFNSDWVEVRSPIFIRQLENEPDFIRLYPEKFSNADVNGNTPFIYSLNKTRTAHFIYKFKYRTEWFKKNWSTHSYLKWRPQKSDLMLNLDLTQIGAKELPPPFFDILKDLKNNSGSKPLRDGIYCTYLKPLLTAEDESLHSTLLGVGGGKMIRVWIDEKPVFVSDQAYSIPRLTQVLIKLKKPASVNTKIEMIVCSSDESAYMGASISLWTPDMINKRCKEKGAAENTYLPVPDFTNTNMPRSTCLAPFSYTRDL